MKISSNIFFLNIWSIYRFIDNRYFMFFNLRCSIKDFKFQIQHKQFFVFCYFSGIDLIGYYLNLINTKIFTNILIVFIAYQEIFQF